MAPAMHPADVTWLRADAARLRALLAAEQALDRRLAALYRRINAPLFSRTRKDTHEQP